MYIGVIADNVADRKQLERLLGRANDAVCQKTGTLYVEAFGDEESLLRAPMKYELFFIDITVDKSLQKKISEKLLSLSVPGKIALCVSCDEPALDSSFSDDILTIRKPVQPADLHSLICDVHCAFEKSHVPTIEIRCEDTTAYVPVANIMYGVTAGHLVKIHLLDGSTLSMLGEISDFYRWLNNYPEFSLIKKDTVINENHVLSKSKREYIMSNGDMISIPLFNYFKKSEF